MENFLSFYQALHFMQSKKVFNFCIILLRELGVFCTFYATVGTNES